MEEKILKLVYDQAYYGELIPLFSFIDKLVEIVVSERKLEKYVKEVKYKSIEDDGDINILAKYNFIEKKIVVNLLAICDSLKNLYIPGSSTERAMFNSCEVTRYILHELEHALQSKKSNDKSNMTLEAKLIKGILNTSKEMLIEFSNGKITAEELKERLETEYIKRRDNYDYNPIERMAEINAQNTVFKSIEDLEKKFPFLFEVERRILLYKMLSGYEDSLKVGSCPTKMFLTNMNQNKLWTDFDFYDEDYNKLVRNVLKNYSFDERILLGLPITDEEYFKLSL